MTAAALPQHSVGRMSARRMHDIPSFKRAFRLPQNRYLRNMSKTTRLLARVVGAFFYTLSVLIHTAKWSFEDGRREIEPPLTEENGQN